MRSPAVGLWKDADHDVARDDVVMFEVMTKQLEDAWWKSYRGKLANTFRQDDLLVGAITVSKLQVEGAMC